MTTADYFRIFEKFNYKENSQVDPNISWFGLDGIEVWFYEDTKTIFRIKVREFSLGTSRKDKFSRGCRSARLTSISSRKKLDRWILSKRMDVETVIRFLKSAHLKYKTWQWKIPVEQIDLESGVCLLCDLSDSGTPGLGQIEINL